MRPLIVLGSDHAGFRIKQFIEALLVARCYRVEDVGAWSTASVDYPDFAEKLALRVRGGRGRMGILTCGTGIGASIAHGPPSRECGNPGASPTTAFMISRSLFCGQPIIATLAPTNPNLG